MRRIRMSNDTIDQCVSEFKSFLQSEKGIKRGKNFEYQVLPPKVEGESKATVTFSERAYSKIILLLEAFNEEVAWHGVASRIEKGQYRIDDIIVYPQYVTGASVKTNALELANWAGNVPEEIYNNIHFQGHSHVRMSVHPSGEDMRDQKKYLDQLEDEDFYIFAVFNKYYDVNLTIYDMKYDLCYEDEDVEFEVESTGPDLGEFLDEAKSLVRHFYRPKKKDLDDYYDKITEEYYIEKEDAEDGLQ